MLEIVLMMCVMHLYISALLLAHNPELMSILFSIQLDGCRTVGHPHLGATPTPKPCATPRWIASAALRKHSQSSGKRHPGRQWCANTPTPR